ncbi:MAG TPA: J domain-containing protein [Terracidiphilus sp.]|nr:J domain-containing protein [Terracidiphilus sp.]
MDTPVHDYYEFLQISPNADADTIHRVYRFLAARLHPDNNQTGHEENFRLLKAAYDVLSDPRRRAEYDAARARNQTPPEPLASTVDFMDVMDGELNRRLAVLAVLYYKRRTNSTFPQIPLSEIEERMGFPRDYLDFTLWYLQKKGYVSKTDNAQYTLTVDGVDFVETQRANIPTLHKLLTSGSQSSVENMARPQQTEAPVAAPEPTAAPPTPRQPTKVQPLRPSGPIVLPASMSKPEDRRLGKPDRRAGKPDPREKKVERRFRQEDWREESQI